MRSILFSCLCCCLPFWWKILSSSLKAQIRRVFLSHGTLAIFDRHENGASLIAQISASRDLYREVEKLLIQYSWCSIGLPVYQNGNTKYCIEYGYRFCCNIGIFCLALKFKIKQGRNSNIFRLSPNKLCQFFFVFSRNFWFTLSLVTLVFQEILEEMVYRANWHQWGKRRTWRERKCLRKFCEVKFETMRLEYGRCKRLCHKILFANMRVFDIC